jgi:DNA-directed RNA polymerase specialized sigma24 family protein
MSAQTSEPVRQNTGRMLPHPVSLRDVRDLEKHVNGAINDHCATTRSYFNPDDRDEIVSELLVKAYELDRKYDPSYGWSFSKYLYQGCRLAVIDWLRKRYGRTGAGLNQVSLTDTDRADIRQQVAEVEVLESINSAVLSPEGRDTLEKIAIPLAQGHSPDEVAARIGWNRDHLNKKRMALRDELTQRAMAA